jgi:hypothetical protein
VIGLVECVAPHPGGPPDRVWSKPGCGPSPRSLVHATWSGARARSMASWSGRVGAAVLDLVHGVMPVAEAQRHQGGGPKAAPFGSRRRSGPRHLWCAAGIGRERSRRCSSLFVVEASVVERYPPLMNSNQSGQYGGPGSSRRWRLWRPTARPAGKSEEVLAWQRFHSRSEGTVDLRARPPPSSAGKPDWPRCVLAESRIRVSRVLSHALTQRVCWCRPIR